ncbi:Hsp70 protein [Murinocardiopsis flavida]|uniref:Hsp70 protein n=1 Tax=Murinocardiopsis flavida TaxID=645275 RepID=A0A2P8DMP3_9ACTN|nr:Hsp70 family protein [Murinocardiopsis flavida]PSK98493.1 Hsp70 protein [Murinocardiopsis flavida]
MSIVVGIDLGTTNSCIAVPAGTDIPGKEELIKARRLRPVGDALVVTDASKSPTTPSVVWIGPDGAVEVGGRAKQKAASGDHPPARFFKRDMGTDQRVRAGHADITPVEASAHVLRHLKRVAEEVLGVPVERAIVTVPAFFEMTAKTETTEAGRLAGLEVVETLIEPVAAALAYTRDPKKRPTGPTTFLVYDLGGGTFDTSVVSWDPETGFENRSFDGDRYLGGYDFDRALVGWVADRVPGYDLGFDADSADGAKTRAKLLSSAEEVKHELTRSTDFDFIAQNCVDRRGAPLNINEPVTRDSFEALIEPRVRGTLTNCDRALAQAGVAADDLADIVMVGGSSRIPLVVDVLAAHFGRRPGSLNPDLCVAVGAAVKAATVTRRSGYLELDHPEPATPATDIGGRVLPGPLLDTPAAATVVLASDDGVFRAEEQADSEGRFLFEDVPIDADEENGFTVRVLARGDEVDAQRLTVEPGGETVPPPSGDVLAHDFAVELVDGLHTVVRAGTMLPYRTEFRLETATKGAALAVRLFEGLVPVGEVAVTGLSSELPVGSAVDVTLEFELGWTIRAEARVPRYDARGEAVILIPQRRVSSWDELRDKTRDLKSGWEERRRAAPPADVMRVGPDLDRQLTEIDALLAEGQDRTKAHHKLVEAETLLQSVRVADASSLAPPWEEYEAALAELQHMIADLARHDAAKAADHRAALPGLRTSGRAAYDAGDRMDWHRANEVVRERMTAVARDMPGGGRRPQMSAAELQYGLLHDIKLTVQAVTDADTATGGRHHTMVTRLTGEFQAVTDEVAQVDITDDKEGMRRLVPIFVSKFKPLRERTDRWLAEIRQERPDVVGLRLPSNPLGG